LSTEAAVRQLQELSHIEKDGLVGAQSWKVFEALNPKHYFHNSGINPIDWALRVPYFSQRDNEYSPSGTCNVTSLAMVLAFHDVLPTKAEQLEDELYLRLHKKDALAYYAKTYPQYRRQGYQPRHVHGMLGWLAKQYGFGHKLSHITWDEMARFGPHSNGGPMITTGAFTRSGHIITIVGQTANKDLIVHDPYGNWDRGYRYDSNGKHRIYNKEDMEEVLRNNKQGFLCHRIWKQ